MVRVAEDRANDHPEPRDEDRAEDRDEESAEDRAEVRAVGRAAGGPLPRAGGGVAVGRGMVTSVVGVTGEVGGDPIGVRSSTPGIRAATWP